MGCCESSLNTEAIDKKAPAAVGVLYAAYGSHNVTEKVRASFEGGDDEIKANNKTFADKDLFAHKTLVVLFLLENNDILFKQTDEGETMSFVDIPRRLIGQFDSPKFAPGIFLALLGEVDVSKTARAMHEHSLIVKEDTVFPPDRSEFEVDPTSKGDLTVFIAKEQEEIISLTHEMCFEGRKLTLPISTPIAHMTEEQASEYSFYGVEEYQKMWVEALEGDVSVGGGDNFFSSFMKKDDKKADTEEKPPADENEEKPPADENEEKLPTDENEEKPPVDEKIPEEEDKKEEKPSEEIGGEKPLSTQ